MYILLRCKKNKKIDLIKSGEGTDSLINFIKGGRTRETVWCDWNIPLHWGGLSDPFQPCERKYRRSMEALKIFAETGYPFVVSTKGKIIADPEYMDLIKQSNSVVQISAICDKYDKIELGAPTFADRIKIVDKLSTKARRVIVRCQPYIHDVFEDVMNNISKFADAGAHGIIFEGMKFQSKCTGTVKVGGDFVQPVSLLKNDFKALRDECHRHGVAFYSGENRLRAMGDSLTCCGIDGLSGFVGNHFNLSHIYNGDTPKPTEAQQKKGSAGAFKSCYQETKYHKMISRLSFEEMMTYFNKNKGKLVEKVLRETR